MRKGGEGSGADERKVGVTGGSKMAADEVKVVTRAGGGTGEGHVRWARGSRLSCVRVSGKLWPC